MMVNNKLLVIGLGNPILGDDGVGWKIVAHVQEVQANNSQVVFEYLSLGGIGLMEQMIGYEQVILVDAIVTGNHPVGTVLTQDIDQLPNRALGHLASAHDTSIQNALVMGKLMGAQLPEQIKVVTVEAQFVYNFTEELSPEVCAAVPKATKSVLDIISNPSKP